MGQHLLIAEHRGQSSLSVGCAFRTKKTGINVWGHQDAKENSLPGQTWVLSKSHLQRLQGGRGGRQPGLVMMRVCLLPFAINLACLWWSLESGVGRC